MLHKLRLWEEILHKVHCKQESYNGLCAKFQNPELKAKLKATGDAVLAECAVRDCIWGIGLSMTDSKRLEMDKWRGQNLLGFALMIVRDAL